MEKWQIIRLLWPKMALFGFLMLVYLNKAFLAISAAVECDMNALWCVFVDI